MIKRAYLLPLLLLVGCATEQTPSALRAAGYVAAEINMMTLVLVVLGGLAFVLTMGLLAYGLWGGRREGALQANLVAGGLVFTVLVLIITFAFNIRIFRTITAAAANPLVIEVTGNQFWWEITYPAYNFETANEIHIPVGTPIELHLRANDVYHALWLPELGVKRDLVPGQTNTYLFEADEARMYWALCSEFCGVQHANMLLVVIAHEPADFETWAAGQQMPAPAPNDELTQRGQELFFEKDCMLCHAIAGTDATGNAGPDLTHLASRLTLGAGAIEYSIGALSGWIANPHGIKPGVLMPAGDLSGEELQALLAYLQTLR